MADNSLPRSFYYLFVISILFGTTQIGAQSTIFSEDFESVTAPALPTSWSSSNPNGGFQFMTGDSTAANSGGFWAIDPHGQFAFASDDACNCDMSEVRLVLPPQNLSSITSTTLFADVWLDNVYGSAPFETARVEVSLDNGSSWSSVGSDFTPMEAWQGLSIDLSAYDGSSNLLISFRFDDNGNWGRGLAVDDVLIQGFNSAECFFTENFESVAAPTLPAGWSSTNPNGGFLFMTGDSTAANSGGFWAIDPHGQFAFASDDACNCNMSETRLLLPPQDFSNYTSVSLKAEVWLDNVYGSAPFETARIEVSTDNGTTWTSVGADFSPLESWQPISIDLSSYDGQNNVLISFRFDDNGNWGRGLAVDNVCLEGVSDVICVFSENFQSNPAPALPAGWSSTNPSGGFPFMTGDSTAANSGGFWAIDPHGQFAFASDDACNCDMSEVRLILPPQDFTDVMNVNLKAEVWLDNVYGSAPFETARIEVSTNNGATWTAVGADFPPLEAWQSISIDLSAYDGMTNVWISFRFDDNGNWGRGLAVDNLCIEGLTNVTCDVTEGFDFVTAPNLPTGWTTANSNGGFLFMTGDSTAANSGGFWAIDPHGQFAFASDDACNCDMSEVRLILPPRDFSTLTDVTLRAQVWLDNVYGSAPFETARVEISTNNGGTWAAVGPDFTPLEAWQNISRDLSPWAGQNNVWIAFRFDDNGNWGRGLAVDNVSVCSPSSGFDAEVTSVSRLNPEYTIVPASQETAAVFSAEVTNLGSNDLTNLVLTSKLFNENDPVTPVAVLTSSPITLSSGGTVTLDNNPGGLPIGGVGRWYAEHTVSHDESASENDAVNDKLVTPIFEISELIYARDDTSSTDQGGFGIGAAVDDNGNIGQTFEFHSEAIIESIQVTLDSPDPGLEVIGVIYNCGANGMPVGAGIDTTEIQLAVGGTDDEFFDLSFDTQITLSPGIYMFSILETGANIGIRGYSDIYTPPGGSLAGTNWVNWDGVTGWTEPTTLVPSFGVAYSIRPVLALEACSPGVLTDGGNNLTVCGNAGTVVLSTGGTEAIPSMGGYGWAFIPGPGASGGVPTGFSITSSTPVIEWNSDLNGQLSGDGLMPLAGPWNIQGFGYSDAANISGSICGFTPSTVTVTFSPDITSAPTSSSATCGLSDGTATANPSGGFGSLTVSWTNGSNGNMISGLAPGAYGFTITDGVGCTAAGEVNVMITDGPNPIVDSTTDVLCNGDATGAIDLSVSGGALPYTFSWSNGSNTEDLNNVTAGTYSVTITDNASCSIQVTKIVVDEPEILTLETSSLAISNVSCFEASDGAIDVTIIGGTSPYSYLWSNGTTTEDLTGQLAGDYGLTVTDANNCVFETSSPFTVTTPDELDQNATIDGESASGAMDGSIQLSVSGGTSPYVYQWSNGATVSDINNLSADVYTVTITDSNGCELIIDYTVPIGVDVLDIEGLEKLSLYPNPTEDLVLINIEMEYAKDVKLDVFSINGQNLFSFQAQNLSEKQYELYMSPYPPGMYIARFIIDGRIISKRFAVVR